MKAKKTKQLLVATALAIGFSVSAKASAVVNGDFETSNLSSPWWGVGQSVVVSNDGNFTSLNPSGQNYQLYFGSDSGWAQAGQAVGVLEAGKDYSLTFQLSGAWGQSGSAFASLNGYDGSLPQGERSQTFASNSFSFNNSWGQATLNLSAATISQSYSAWIGKELNIVIGFNSGNVFSVDNVTLTAAPITAVPIIVIGNNLIGDFETGPNDFGSFWKNGSFAAYDHSWGDVADQTPPLANGGQFYAYTSGEFGQIGKTMGTLQANTNYTLSLNYQSIYDSEDRPYIELLAYNATSRVETLLAAGYAGPTSGVWRTGSLSLSAAEISANNPALIGQEFNVKISGYAIAVDNVTLTAAPTYAGWAADKAGSQAANLDWDNDGVSNGIEYFMNATPGLTVNPGLVGNRVTWPNGGNISSSAYGTKFVVQSSIDLVTWADVPSNDPNLENTPNSVTYTFSVYDADKQFVRLKVTLN